MNVDLAHAIDATRLENYLPIHEPETQALLPLVEKTPEREFLLKNRYENLSLDAKEVIEIIMNPPREFQDRLNIKNSKKITQGKLIEFLRAINPNKWKFIIIQLAFEEIKMFLREES